MAIRQRSIGLVGPDDYTLAEHLILRPFRVAPTSESREAGEKNKFRVLGCGLPTVHSGPIVRRVDPRAAWIWMATCAPVEVHAWVVDGASAKGTDEDARLGEGRAKSIRLGKRLHITLVRVAASPAPYPTDRVLAYNATITLTAKRHYYHGEVAFHQSDITLDPFPLPTFLIPSQERKKVSFIHASCRKHHGHGADSLPRALEHLESTADSTASRPTQLLLTGDQIYADDVSDDALDFVRIHAVKLLGYRERWEIDGQETFLSNIGPGERGELMKPRGFTSGHGTNHLLGFGEFAAMYVLSWSPAHWKKKYNVDLRKLIEYGSEMRKLLANMSTYMGFDDHEITDDWNISYEWRDKVEQDPLARRVVSNGLAAFWAFQWLGNDPGLGQGPRAAVRRYVDSKYSDGTDFDRTMWEFSDWGFVAEMRPQAIFLDTRTQRDLLPGETTSFLDPGTGPGLMGVKALRRLEGQLAGLRGGPEEPVMIVSPAPVLGIALAEEARARTRFDAVDPEDWSLNPGSFFGFLDVLVDSGKRRFLMLSGDVHFAYSAVARYYRTAHGRSKDIEIIQFTSSAVRNEHSSKLIGALQGIASGLTETSHFGREATGGAAHLTWRKRGPQLSSQDRELQWRFLSDSANGLIVGTNNIGVVDMDLDTGAGFAAQSLRLAGSEQRDTRAAWADLFSFLDSGVE